MPISGLVLTLSPDVVQRENAVAAIRQDQRIEMGVLEGNRLAIVVDTQSDNEDKQIWQWLSDLGGVVFIDVVLVGFEDSQNL
ncbi:MAG: hypothetical protein ACO1RT_11155 [Planctomycetaceae bacterium]